MELNSEAIALLKQEASPSQFNGILPATEEALAQLKQEGSATALKAILTSLESQQLTETSAQEIIKQVVKEQNVKKGLVMRSLRAALTGDVHGPDLIQSWLLLKSDWFRQAAFSKGFCS